MEQLDARQDKPKITMHSQLDVLKFIDQRARALKTTSSIQPDELDKDHRNMGWVTKYDIKSTFATNTQLSKEVVYRDPLVNNLKSSYPDLNCVISNDKYATDTLFSSEL